MVVSLKFGRKYLQLCPELSHPSSLFKYPSIRQLSFIRCKKLPGTKGTVADFNLI